MTWTADDTALIAWAVAGIAVIVVLIAQLKLHPFLALVLGSAVVGLGSGLGTGGAIESFETGFGKTLAGTGILIALGTMLGKMLAASGGADRIADTILARAGERRLPWAMALIAMVIGIPLFFEVGVVLIMPVVFLVARRAQGSVMRVGIPSLAGLSVMHGLLAPHPGPLVAIGALGADLGQTMAYGFLVAIPTLVVAGPIYGAWIARRVAPTPPPHLVEQFERAPGRGVDAPSFATTLATVLLPVALMLGKALADVTLAAGHPVRAAIDTLGSPVPAMLIAVLVASVTFGYLRGMSRRRVTQLLGESLEPIAGIILIIGAGGGFKQVLVAGGVGAAVGKAALASALSPLVVGWLVAVAIRLATGSATVATVTASGLMAPVVEQLPATSAPLLALSIGAGSLFLSHVNDAGFWMVKEYFGMSLGQTFATWSAMETILSVVALLSILALAALTGGL
ncbi:MAG TPA: gluconate:H+ symporter [Kofleriaceae bacterium]|nr:gluconate:H+ symporter [Kofleriaceae bacterium]